jgi:hypothetical protein
MLLSKSAWHFIVEDLLGVRPEECAHLMARADRDASADDVLRTVSRTLIARSTIAGVAPGVTESWLRTIPLALLEQRSAMQKRALLVACASYLDDPGFFDRPDWPLVALGGDEENDAMIAIREAARFALRLTIVRAAHAGMAALPFSRWLAGGVGAAFNAFEMGILTKRLVREREARLEGHRVPEFSSRALSHNG